MSPPFFAQTPVDKRPNSCGAFQIELHVHIFQLVHYPVTCVPNIVSLPSSDRNLQMMLRRFTSATAHTFVPFFWEIQRNS